jgi:hypothetical protein
VAIVIAGMPSIVCTRLAPIGVPADAPPAAEMVSCRWPLSGLAAVMLSVVGFVPLTGLSENCVAVTPGGSASVDSVTGPVEPL